MSYSIHKVTPTIVYIIDNDDGKTVTNMAEEVVAELASEAPDHRIIYRDTDGYWSELVHKGTEFIGFRNAEPPTIQS